MQLPSLRYYVCNVYMTQSYIQLQFETMGKQSLRAIKISNIWLDISKALQLSMTICIHVNVCDLHCLFTAYSFDLNGKLYIYIYMSLSLHN